MGHYKMVILVAGKRHLVGKRGLVSEGGLDMSDNTGWISRPDFGVYRCR